ncbi:VWA domain-containing protein [Actinoplanes sp. NPDC051633]|uniref:vWA domain-containing protein n=1 Tax=Actinoplanes sp. NPDC051633 TaxID=3155670 RepID=UPI0034293954
MNSPLGGLDRAAFAVALTERLRAAGVRVGLSNVRDLIAALTLAMPRDAAELYWIARITLVHRREDLAAFESVLASERRNILVDIAARPDDALTSMPGRHDGAEDGGGLPWMTLPPVVADADRDDPGTPVPHRLPSALDALADRPFADLDERETAAFRDWLRDAVRRWPVRRSRRQAIGRAGHRIALRPTIARARRTGWEPLALVHVKPVRTPRRVVMLCDVSQSMQAQIPAYRLLMEALSDVARAETFAFATRLTRLRGGVLEAEDAHGGTRIATAIHEVTRSHDDLLRGAIVLIASDGWDSDPAETLATAMARLRRLAHRVIWLNPRAGAPGYEPTVAAMAAALPHCDAHLPADTFTDLRAALSRIKAHEINSAPRAAPSRRPGS